MPSQILMKYFTDSSIPSEKRDAMLNKLDSGEVTEEQLERVIQRGYSKRGRFVAEGSVSGATVTQAEKDQAKMGDIGEEVGARLGKGLDAITTLGGNVEFKIGDTSLNRLSPMTKKVGRVVGEGLAKEADTSIIDRGKNVLSTAGQGLYNIGAGTLETGVNLLNPINPFSEKSNYEASQDAMAGLNRTIEGGFQTVASPLAASPLAEDLVQLPVDAVKSSIESGVESAGIDPNSEQGQNTVNSYMNALGLIMGAKSIKGKGKLSLKDGLETTKQALAGTPKTPKMVTEFAKNKIEGVKNIGKSLEQIQGKYETQLNETLGKITQSKGRPKDLAAAKEALRQIDIEGVKTFKDLSGSLQSKIDVFNKKVTEKLQGSDVVLKLNELTKTFTREGRKTDINYVSKALDHLKELYKKTENPQRLLRVETLMDKAKIDGLTPLEINKIAKEYGSEFGRKAFDAKGDPRTSVNAVQYENIRNGVKKTMRDLLPDDAAKLLDEQMSSMITAKKLIDNVQSKVEGLQNRVVERGIGEKLGNRLGDAFDFITAGAAKGFLSRLIPRNVGLKTLNSLDLQKKLPEFLKQMDDINKKIGAAKTETQLIDLIPEILKTSYGISQKSANVSTGPKTIKTKKEIPIVIKAENEPKLEK